MKGHIDSLNSHLETINQMKKERSDNILWIRTLITNSVRRLVNRGLGDMFIEEAGEFYATRWI